MNMKRILIIFLIVLAMAGSLTAVASSDIVLPDNIKDSSVTVYHSHSQKSTKYAYYYEDTMEFDRDAYYAPWSIEASIDFDVKKLYNSTNDDPTYSLKDFKKDLSKAIDNNDLSLYGVFVDCHDGLVRADDINETDLSCSLNEDSSVLTVYFNYIAEDYVNINGAHDVDKLDGATALTGYLKWDDAPDSVDVEQEDAGEIRFNVPADEVSQ